MKKRLIIFISLTVLLLIFAFYFLFLHFPLTECKFRKIMTKRTDDFSKIKAEIPAIFKTFISSKGIKSYEDALKVYNKGNIDFRKSSKKEKMEYAKKYEREMSDDIKFIKNNVFPVLLNKKSSVNQEFKKSKNDAEIFYYTAIQETGYYWLNLCLINDYHKNYDASLLTAYGVFYAAQNNIDKGINTIGDFFVINSLINNSADYISSWAAEPKNSKLSKYIAKYILVALKKKISLKKLFINDMSLFIKEIKEYASEAGIIPYIAVNSSFFNTIIDKYTSVFSKNIDKPYIEAQSELFRTDCDLDQYLPTNYINLSSSMNVYEQSLFIISNIIKGKTNLPRSNYFDFALMYGLSPIKTWAGYLVSHRTNHYSLYVNNYKALASMEISAIGLAINAYYNEYKQLPNSLKELEKWLGIEFPLDPFSGNPYIYNQHKNILLQSSEAYNDFSEEYDKSLIFNFNR